MTCCWLVAAALALLGTLSACGPASGDSPATRPAEAWKNVSPSEAEELHKDPQMIILDVRTPGEHKAGHIPRAVNINLYDKDFGERLDALDKSKPVLVYCASGNRSVPAAKTLAAKGFDKLYHLEKGFQGWARAGKAVE